MVSRQHPFIRIVNTLTIPRPGKLPSNVSSLFTAAVLDSHSPSKSDNRTLRADHISNLIADALAGK